MKVKEFLVSVVIPVFNAADYVTQAVESAISQAEVGEVMLVEDGSPDESLAVCQKLADKYNKVILLKHPNGENRGPGASRNLGIKKAKLEYIAFLDADDYFLSGRFSASNAIFKSNPSCGGVYEAIGIHIESEDALRRWKDSGKPKQKLFTISKKLDPEVLASELISGKHGSFHLDGLVIRKDILKKSGYMNETLKLHQDSEFNIRLAIITKLLAGRIQEPVALRRIHENNRISAPRSKGQEYKNRMDYWMSLYHWCKSNAKADFQRQVLEGIIRYTKLHKYFKDFPRQYFPTKLIWWTRFFRLIGYPEVIFALLKGAKTA